MAASKSGSDFGSTLLLSKEVTVVSFRSMKEVNKYYNEESLKPKAAPDYEKGSANELKAEKTRQGSTVNPPASYATANENVCRVVSAISKGKRTAKSRFWNCRKPKQDDEMWSLTLKTDRDETVFFLQLHPKVKEVLYNALDRLAVITQEKGCSKKEKGKVKKGHNKTKEPACMPSGRKKRALKRGITEISPTACSIIDEINNKNGLTVEQCRDPVPKLTNACYKDYYKFWLYGYNGMNSAEDPVLFQVDPFTNDYRDPNVSPSEKYQQQVKIDQLRKLNFSKRARSVGPSTKPNEEISFYSLKTKNTSNKKDNFVKNSTNYLT